MQHNHGSVCNYIVDSWVHIHSKGWVERDRVYRPAEHVTGHFQRWSSQPISWLVHHTARPLKEESKHFTHKPRTAHVQAL